MNGKTSTQKYSFFVTILVAIPLIASNRPDCPIWRNLLPLFPFFGTAVFDAFPAEPCEPARQLYPSLTTRKLLDSPVRECDDDQFLFPSLSPFLDFSPRICLMLITPYCRRPSVSVVLMIKRHSDLLGASAGSVLISFRPQRSFRGNFDARLTQGGCGCFSLLTLAAFYVDSCGPRPVSWQPMVLCV